MSVGLFVGTSAFHIGPSFWKITSNFNKVAAPAPASYSGLHQLAHKDNIWSFDHLATMTILSDDAPRPDEIVVIMAISDGGRPHPRVGKGRV